MTLVDYLDENPQARVGKFVLLQIGEAFYMVRAIPSVCEFHAEIVARFAPQHGLQAQLSTDRGHLQRRPEGLRIHGGGYWERRQDERVRLYAKSGAFGPFDESLFYALDFDAPFEWYIDT